MRPPRMTIRRLMMVVAVMALGLGLFMEIPRVRQRWEYSQEEALIHAQQAEWARLNERRDAIRLMRAEAILRRLATLGPEPRDLDAIIMTSGDPDLAGWFFKNQTLREMLFNFDANLEADRDGSSDPVAFFTRGAPQLAAEFLQGAADRRRPAPLLPRDEIPYSTEPRPISPVVAARFISGFWIDHWRKSLRDARRTRSAQAHDVQSGRYERASWRPWEPIPTDPPALRHETTLAR